MQLIWFRRDLRTQDNTALHGAVSYARAHNEAVTAIFVATPDQWAGHDMAPIQADLIYRRLFALQKDLQGLHIELLYKETKNFEEAARHVAATAERLQAGALWFNREYALNEYRRDLLAEKLMTVQGRKANACHDTCLCPPGTVLNRQGTYYKVFTPFARACNEQLQGLVPSLQPLEPVAKAELPLDIQGSILSPEQPFSYPRLSSSAYHAGTKAIHKKLTDFCAGPMNAYDQKRDFPAVAGTSGLSPYLAIGALSARTCLSGLISAHRNDPGCLGGAVWKNELLWRDFYHHLMFFIPGLSRQECFHAWGDRLWWDDNPERFAAWQAGKTGYPIVDAAMRQLNQTGWMHNRLRMIVASFLTKDLHIDWHHGQAYFMRHLVDGDFAANNGGWQWSASTGCDAQPFFRIFNPVSQGKKFDPGGRFVRTWLPELQQVPDRYVHCPWIWSGSREIAYPAPIVDHSQERLIALQRYSKESKRN
ncbi:deoxyribodipyrimidine photo-lyase [uncultured Desulfobacter sp.]|uniref:deoxyribodipyrimidine photo-lyase n=1 Tax=uncultured Desulfobacter sp. TaxID=240139 RepID=UPI002AABD030|nr:deoxyribodipyrimidine photo-lyase [uncultured Desulfobacter sp.]